MAITRFVQLMASAAAFLPFGSGIAGVLDSASDEDMMILAIHRTNDTDVQVNDSNATDLVLMATASSRNITTEAGSEQHHVLEHNTEMNSLTSNKLPVLRSSLGEVSAVNDQLDGVPCPTCPALTLHLRYFKVTPPQARQPAVYEELDGLFASRLIDGNVTCVVDGESENNQNNDDPGKLAYKVTIVDEKGRTAAAWLKLKKCLAFVHDYSVTFENAPAIQWQTDMQEWCRQDQAYTKEKLAQAGF